MDYEEIIKAIRQSGGGLSRDTAERAAQATLQTLAERLHRGEARHILQELPAELKPFIYTDTDAEALDIDEFLSRVADREGTDVETALRHARAVFAAPAVRSARRRCSTWRPPFPRPTIRWSRRHSSATGRSCRRTSSGTGSGSRSAWAAPRPARSPRRCSRPWRNGSLPARWRTSWPSSIRCCTRRCGRAWRRPRPGRGACPLRTSCGGRGAGGRRDRRGRGTLFSQVFEHARAVFATLSEAVSRKEWFDIVVELPEDYRPLMPAGIA